MKISIKQSSCRGKSGRRRHGVAAPVFLVFWSLYHPSRCSRWCSLWIIGYDHEQSTCKVLAKYLLQMLGFKCLILMGLRIRSLPTVFRVWAFVQNSCPRYATCWWWLQIISLTQDIDLCTLNSSVQFAKAILHSKQCSILGEAYGLAAGNWFSNQKVSTLPNYSYRSLILSCLGDQDLRAFIC